MSTFYFFAYLGLQMSFCFTFLLFGAAVPFFSKSVVFSRGSKKSTFLVHCTRTVMLLTLLGPTPAADDPKWSNREHHLCVIAVTVCPS
jgi:hypothetical protein